MNNKPFENVKEVTYDMITKHPYFRKLNDQELVDIINYMRYSDYQLLKGSNSDVLEKLNYLKELWKIIGYNLIKPEFQSAINELCGNNWWYEIGAKNLKNDYQFVDSNYPQSIAEKLRKAGVLDLWFEPVYKEKTLKFKVGDWVLTSKSASGWGSSNVHNKILQITRIELETGINRHFRIYFGNEKTILEEIVRLATSEEIKKATEEVISMNSKFNLTIKDGKVFHKNEDITSYVKSVGNQWSCLMERRSYLGKDFCIKDVILSKTGCESQETYLSDWLKVYEKIK